MTDQSDAAPWVDPLLDAPPLPTLPAKGAGASIPDASAVLAFLLARGVPVNGDAVSVKADGSVEVDTGDPASALAAWADYAVPEPVPPRTRRERLQEELDAVATLAQLRAFVRDRLIPEAIADE